MQRPFHEHIAYLQHKIRALESQLKEPDRTAEERSLIRADLRVAQLSLVHYQKAHEQEQRTQGGRNPGWETN
jgi:hypothetical protein